MLDLPWSAVLTALFVGVGSYCAWVWAKRYQAGADAGETNQVVHVDHAVMSVLMIVMIWWPAGEVLSFVQALIFGLFSVALVRPLLAATDAVQRVDLVTHIAMNAAMGWMLLAMPMLMGHAPGGSGGGHGEHGGSGGGGMEMIPTPAWADAVNLAVIIGCVAIAGWWLVRLARAQSHRLHYLCHVLGAAGMALMLALM